MIIIIFNADVINLKDKKHYRIDLKRKILEGVDTKGQTARNPFKKQGVYIGWGGSYIDETQNIISFGKNDVMWDLKYNEKYDFYCWKVKFTEDFSINFYRILLNDGTRIYYGEYDILTAEAIFGKK